MATGAGIIWKDDANVEGRGSSTGHPGIARRWLLRILGGFAAVVKRSAARGSDVAANVREAQQEWDYRYSPHRSRAFATE